MKKISVVSIALFSLFIFAACGSMVAYKTGDKTKSYLQGVKKISLKIDYSKAAVGKFSSEEEYVAKKEADGKADFREKWETQKSSNLLSTSTQKKRELKLEQRSKATSTWLCM